MNGVDEIGEVGEAPASVPPVPDFDPVKATFGRAQTFPLRLGWLPKACELARDGGDFVADELIAEWGVGKNMLAAIRHWAMASGVIYFVGNKPKLTALGSFIFGDDDGKDPYLEDDATLWLLHWRINSRPDIVPAGFWFFNRFVKRAFSEHEAVRELTEQMQSKVAENTVRRDINMLLRMYCRRGKVDDEESLATPFPGLGLITYDDAVREYRAEFERRDTLSPGVVGYAAAQLLQTARDPMIIRVRAASANRDRAILEYIFRLDGDSLLEKLADFCAKMGGFQLRQVGGTWELSLNGGRMPPQDKLLQAAYQN